MEIVLLKMKLSVLMFALFFLAPLVTSMITRWLGNKYMKWNISYHLVYAFTFVYGMSEMAEFVSAGGFEGWTN